MAARNLANMTPEDRETKVAALKPEWAQQYIRQLEALTRALATQLQAAQAMDGGLTQANMIHAAGNGQAPEVAPSVWTPAGVTPPDGEYATLRVVDGSANMEPIADLPDRAEVRVADFYQVHYGDHESTGGMRVLVIQGDGPIQVRPVDQATVLIARGGTETR